jgi:Holliday junction resolvase RusA-like endonuclease
MQIIIPFKTPTINHLYLMHGRFRFMTKEAKEIKKEIIDIVDKIKKEQFNITPKLKISIDVYEDWLTKKGEVKIKDLANREKFLIDCVFEALGIDDKFIFEHIMKKIQSETEEKAVITIEEIR